MLIIDNDSGNNADNKYKQQRWTRMSLLYYEKDGIAEVFI